MNKTLPYRADTATGDRLDVLFRLHADTGSAMRVSQLLDAVLQRLDHELGLLGETSNGDVLQALCMAAAIRAGMIHAPTQVTAGLTRQLLETALQAVAEAGRQSPPSGRA